MIRTHTLRWALVLAIAALTLQGCAFFNKVSGKDAAAARRLNELRLLQLKVMRFADEYVGGISEPVDAFEATADKPEDRLRAQNWKLTQATAAYTNASGPNPVTNAVDMVVLATLSRMVVDDEWVRQTYGKRAVPLQEAQRRLELQARDLLTGVLSSDQTEQLQHVIEDWRSRNPTINAVSYIRFGDLAKSIGQPDVEEGGASSGLFAFLGIDPFSSLDPAVREIARTRQVAERAIYYAQRAPNLINMQVERFTFQLATLPETQRMLTDVDHFGGAAASVQQLANELPNVIARERQAAIAQFIDAMNAQTTQTQALVAQVRGALDAGTATSNSLTQTIHAFDQLVDRFDKPQPANAPPAPPGRPFDITEYTAAAAELTRAEIQLQQLIASIDGGVPELTRSANRAASMLQGVADHVLWRTLLVGALLLLGGLATALTYRGIAKRFS